MTEHILFLTGKLAEKRLHRVLESMQPVAFSYEVRNMGVSVAALMTASMIARRLEALDGVSQIMVPGLCRGNLEELSGKLQVPVVRGPVDVKDLPVYFGGEREPPDLSRHDVLIFAEIVEAAMISTDEILARAEAYRGDGADVIDLGCLPDTDFPHMEEAIAALGDAGYQVSVDSLERDDLLRGGRAGADYLLSLSEQNLDIADEVASTPIVIPEPHADMASLYRCIEHLAKTGRRFIADSVLDPIHFGFTDSILRYHELRQQCPDTEIMMGIGNLTELTEADTTGINAILFGIISELHINAVLTTQVSPHARAAVREADLARRIMYAARGDQGLPKGLDGGLASLHERRPNPATVEEVEELAREIRDPNYRVQITEEGIYVFNRDGLVSGVDPFALFPDLSELEDDAPHAFYMGVELARAQIAWQLGKRYDQDRDLDWGVAVRSEEPPDDRSDENFPPEGSTLKASREAHRKRAKS